MKLGIERYDPQSGQHQQMRIYYNLPEDGSYIEFLNQIGIKSYDRIWVDKNKQVCVPCRMRKILTYQFGLKGVDIYEFDD